MNEEERARMVIKEVGYDLVTLSNTNHLSIAEDSAEVRQHSLMVSKERLEALPQNLQDAIKLYATILENSFDYLECDLDVRGILIDGITIFVTHMLKTGALKLGNV